MGVGLASARIGAMRWRAGLESARARMVELVDTRDSIGSPAWKHAGNKLGEFRGA